MSCSLRITVSSVDSCDIPIEKIAADPIETAKNFARQYGVTLLLKGNPTIIAGSEGQVLINTSGTEALATAGSGDVLSGMIVSVGGKRVRSFQCSWSSGMVSRQSRRPCS